MNTVTHPILGALNAALWLGVSVTALRGLRSMPALPPLGPGPDVPPDGRLGIVIAARDDGPALERCVRDLCAQQGAGAFRIVAVDDRSSDDTQARLARIDDPRLEVLRIEALPEGWLGKPHACWSGARALGDTVDWLLFLDADAQLGPELVARARQEAQRTGADHLSLIPQLRDQTGPGRWLTLTMALGLAVHAAGMERDRPRSYFGVGAFTLIRRPVYEAIGGHEGLRMQVIEDVMLAKAVRRSGARSRLRFAVDAFSVRWITGFDSAFQVLEKNYFALSGFSLARVLGLVVLVLMLWLSAFRLEAHGAWPFWGLMTITLPARGLARRYGWSPLYAVLTPLAVPTVLAIMLNSAVATLRRGGILWRDTFYPLADLRRAASAYKWHTERCDPGSGRPRA